MLRSSPIVIPDSTWQTPTVSRTGPQTTGLAVQLSDDAVGIFVVVCRGTRFDQRVRFDRRIRGFVFCERLLDAEHVQCGDVAAVHGIFDCRPRLRLRPNSQLRGRLNQRSAPSDPNPTMESTSDASS